jgi:hypothetical protein
MVTLIHAMQPLGRKRGMSGIYVGGGEALAIEIERP